MTSTQTSSLPHPTKIFLPKAIQDAISESNKQLMIDHNRNFSSSNGASNPKPILLLRSQLLVSNLLSTIKYAFVNSPMIHLLLSHFLLWFMIPCFTPDPAPSNDIPLTEFRQPLQVQRHLEMPRILVQLGHIQRT